MSNSKLVDYVRLCNNYNPRVEKISKITIHHMAGNLSVETCGNVFVNAANASANYGIDGKGRVGMYVEEKNRSWASSSEYNDQRAVTIEVANDVCGGNWHVSDVAFNKLIDLCVDICVRNDIKKLNYTGDSSGNLTRHNMFASTTCPGPYLQSKFPEIAKKVNERLEEIRMSTLYKKGDKCIGILGIKEQLISLYKNKVIKSKVAEDCVFGDGTEAAIKEVQKLAKISVTGQINEATVKAIAKLVADNATKIAAVNGDVNGDGKVNMEDVTTLQKKIAGL